MRVALVLAVSVLLAGTGAYALNERRLTLTSAEVETAVRNYERASDVELYSTDQLNDLFQVAARPTRCQAVILPTDSALDGVGATIQGGRRGTEIRALRFSSPYAARSVLREVRAAVTGCPTVELVADDATPEENKVLFNVALLPGTGGSDRLEYTLGSDEVTFGLYARQTGNLLIWSVGGSTDTAHQRRLTAVDDLVTHLSERPG